MEQFSGIIMLVIFFVIMYFTLIRPQKKRDKEVKDMRDNISVGDEVITIGGIHGKVVKVKDEVVTLELPFAKQRIEFSKWAVGSVSKESKDKTDREEIEETTDNEDDK